jgi:hypothetical protein
VKRKDVAGRSAQRQPVSSSGITLPLDGIRIGKRHRKDIGSMPLHSMADQQAAPMRRLPMHCVSAVLLRSIATLISNA